MLALPVKYAGTPGEMVALSDAGALTALLVEWLGSRRTP
jgi:putative aminopeptidase FrvX